MIVSKDNETIKKAKKLLDKKERLEIGCFLIEGKKLVDDAIKKSIEVSKIFCTEENFEKYIKFQSNKLEVVSVSHDVIKVLSDTKTNQGVIAIAKRPEAKVFNQSNCVVLDNVQDPKNVGSIIRTCAGVGINFVILIDCADPYSPKAMRAGMSGQYYVNILEVDYSWVKEFSKEMLVICTDMQGDNIFNFEVDKNFMLILGNEGNGISQQLKSLASKTVAVPMINKVESLNVSVSAGIILYQLVNQKWR